MPFSLNYTGIRNCPLKIEIFQLPDGFRLNRLVGDWLLMVANIKDKSNGATVYAPGGGYCHIWAFQAVYSGIGYINQNIWIYNRVSFFRKLISWWKILSRLGNVV